MRSKHETVKLSPGELEIMEILWSEGGLSLSQAHRLFLRNKRKIGYTTVQTRLNRLVDKGLVERDDEPYPAVYRPLLQRERISGRYFDLLEELCGGNLVPLVLHLSRKRRFSPEELDALKTVLDDQMKQDAKVSKKNPLKKTPRNGDAK